MKLLVNRYRIFLTRGIKGTYVFCEDEETRKFLKDLFR
ncbi:DNA/RNA helicase domain-containing protein [Methanocaldococcus sp. FS406-22]